MAGWLVALVLLVAFIWGVWGWIPALITLGVLCAIVVVAFVTVLIFVFGE